MESRYDYDIIRDYLHGLVAHERAMEIAELIRTDEVARTIAEGILQLENEFNENDQDIETYLENFRQSQLTRIQAHSNKKAEHQVRNRLLKIAAAVLLLVIAGFAIQRISSKPDLMTLVDQDLAQPYPVSNVSRSPTSGSDYNKGFELYNNKNYVQASLYFEKASENHSDLATIIFYNGLSSLYSGHYNRAIALLESPKISVSRYSQQAQWYLSLAYIKSDNKQKGIDILERIKYSPRHYKHDSAVQLLAALD